MYGEDWELILGTTSSNWPTNEQYAEFEAAVNVWSHAHNHGQSAVFGKTAAAARYWAEMMKADIRQATDPCAVCM